MVGLHIPSSFLQLFERHVRDQFERGIDLAGGQRAGLWAAIRGESEVDGVPCPWIPQKTGQTDPLDHFETLFAIP